MGLFTKLFGTRSEREIKQIRPIVDKILGLETEYRNLSEEALKAKTQVHKLFTENTQFTLAFFYRMRYDYLALRNIEC